MLSAMLMNGPHSPPASVNSNQRYVPHPHMQLAAQQDTAKANWLK